TPTISFLGPFGCHVTILNTIDHLGKFDGKADEGFFLGYSLNSKAFRVFNSRTRTVEENLNARFSENTPNNIGIKESNGARKEKEPEKEIISCYHFGLMIHHSLPHQRVLKIMNSNRQMMVQRRKVAQGHTHEEGIDYDEVFALVVRIEAIRLFLAYASFNDFIVYQMDVNSAFLYGKIEEEVYVCQPPRFEDLDFPDKVYKVEKALYGLHQAPR
nr:ribonuclease H-like domain-containing protein [Tanacetum cinerariifolium]